MRSFCERNGCLRTDVGDRQNIIKRFGDMRLQKGKWYVCIKSWSDDGWTKFAEGDLLQCEHDDQMTDCYGITHLFVADEPDRTFREASINERNIASATEVNIDEFMESVDYFDTDLSTKDIYRKGAESMLRHIKARMSII